MVRQRRESAEYLQEKRSERSASADSSNRPSGS